jgi:hypothetical protein
MTLQDAEKWLKEWKQDIDNLSIEVRGENVVPLVSVKMVVKHLLEAQKIIERERAVKIAQEIVRSNRFDSDIIDTLNELKQEILQSTKE